MNKISSLTLAFYLLVIFLHAKSNGQAQPKAQPPPTSNGYNCSSPKSYPCKSYAFYRVGYQSDTFPPLLDLSSIADLFLLPRLTLARANNLPVNASLSVGQPLLIPLACACSSNLSYAAVPYQINAGDTYYRVSSFKFGNLTSYPTVMKVNPKLIPTALDVGQTVIFPIFCACSNGSKIMITYTYQPGDSYPSIAKEFGTDVESLVETNGNEKNATPYLTILIPVSKVPPPVVLNYRPAVVKKNDTNVVVEKNDRNGVIVGLSVGLGLMGMLWLISLMCIFCFWRKGYLGKKVEYGNEKYGNGKEKNKKFMKSSSSDKLMVDISDWLDKYKVYSYDELSEATAGFGRTRLIQGSVYKGMIDGEVYAIKKMKWNACDELKILQKVNHTNLVKLEGFCIEPNEGSCYLVYEYIENGSLSSWLHDPTKSGSLDWRTRVRIALELAHGLQYIHEHTWPRVVHKDIKSSNVLLDSKMHAKIANFGLAKTGCNAVTTHIVGTQGYIAPEYLVDGLVTTKMDVFAFGVVLLELVSGKEAVGENGEVLWMEVEGVFAKDGRVEGRVLEWMDKRIAKDQSIGMDTVMNVMGIARACLNKDASRRPSMVDVAYGLSKFDDMWSDFSEDGVVVGDVVAR